MQNAVPPNVAVAAALRVVRKIGTAIGFDNINTEQKGEFRMKHTARILLSCVATLMLTASSYASELPASIKEANKIRMLVDAVYPPMEYFDPDTGKLTGLDVDLGEEIGKRLGVEVEFINAKFAQLIPSLETGRADLIISSMGDTKERQETLDFIDYLKIGGQFYTLSGSDSFNTREDLCGYGVATGRSTSIPEEIRTWSAENCVSQGKPAINVVDAQTVADARVSLELGRADAAAVGAHAVRYNMQLFPGRFKLVGEPFNGKVAGVAFLKKDSELRDAVHAAMNDMVADGTYQKIFDKWKMGDLTIVPLTINNQPAK